MERLDDKVRLRENSKREIFTLSVRNYITHYQVRRGSFLLAVVLFAMFIGLILLRLPSRAALVASGIIIYSSLLAVYPYLGLYAQIWLYFRPVVFWGGPQLLRPVFLVSFLTMVFFLLNFVIIKKKRVKFPMECKLALLLLFFMVLSSFFAVHSTSLSFSLNVVFFKVIVFYFLVINLVNSKRELNAFVWIIIILCASVALEAIKVYRFYGYARVDNVGGVHREANFLATILVMTLPLLFHKMNSRNIYEKVVSLGLVPIFLAGIVLTGSRGGTIGLLGVLGLLVWRFRKKGRILLVFVLLVLVAAAVAPSHYWARAKTIASFSEARTAQTRIELWKAGLQMYGEHPLTGVGQGNFAWLSPQYTDYYYHAWTGEGFVAHNTFIQLLAEGGIQTLLAFLAFLAWTFRGLYRARRRLRSSPGGENLLGLTQALEIGLVGYLICGLFLSVASVDILYWLLALGPVISTMAEQGSEKQIASKGLGVSAESDVRSPSISS